MTKRSFLRTTVLFTLGTIVGKILGFLKEVSIGSIYGTTAPVDAYGLAMTIPTIVFSGLTGAFAISFIPIFMRKYRENQEEAYLFMNNFLHIMLLIFIVPILLMELLAEPLIALIGFGFPPEVQQLSVTMLRIITPMVLFTFLGDTFNAYLNGFHHFKVTAIYWIVFNGVTLLIFLSFVDDIGIIAVAVGMLIASLFQGTIPLFASRKIGYRYQFRVNWHDPGLKEMVRLGIPAFITSIAIQLNLAVDKSLATSLGEGAIAALNYAQKLYFLPLGLVAGPIATVVYPILVEAYTDKDRTQFKQTVQQTTNVLLILFIPVAMFLVWFAAPTIRLAFGYGMFGEKSVALTAFGLQFYALAALAQPLKDFYDRVLFAMQLNRKIMWITIVSVIVTILLNFTLIIPLRHGGLALATSLGVTLSVLALIYVYKQVTQDGQLLRHSLPALVKAIVASIIALCVAYGTLWGLEASMGQFAAIISYLLAIPAYLLALWLMKTKELLVLFQYRKREGATQK